MTDKKTEALKLALEALEGMYIEGFTQDNSPINNAITAIREALAEQPAPASKPWVETNNQVCAMLRHAHDVLALSSLPPSKPWVGLTEEDIEAAMPGGIYDCLADPWDCGVGDGDYMRSIKNDVVRIVRAIEAKLKEKNHG